MTVDALNNTFGLPGILRFAEDAERGDLPCALVTLPGCTAQVFLHGAHLAAWQPTGLAPALFLSERSAFADGKAIRGGIPICFPWFGPRSFSPSGQAPAPGAESGQPSPAEPSHGFARLRPWQVTSAALLPSAPAGSDVLHLAFMLEPDDQSRALGYGSFRVAYELIFGAAQGRTLTLRLSVANLGTEPFAFEEALHTYFAVANVAQTTLAGFESATFLDKTDGFRAKQAPASPLRFAAQTDSVFPGNRSTAVIHDLGGTPARTVTVERRNSASAVVWNPWSDGAAKLSDLAPDAWPGFLCVEAANVGADRILLVPGEAHTMETRITVDQAPDARDTR